jgi:hypothetical protein
MSKLIVLPAGEVNAEELAHRVFGSGAGLQKLSQKEIITLQKDHETLRINNQTGKIIYINEKGLYPLDGWSKEEAQKSADHFVRQIGYNFPKMKMDAIREDKEHFLLEYHEVYKGQVLFNSYIKLKLTPKGIIEARVYRSKPQYFADHPREICSGDEALFTFVHAMKAKGVRGPIKIESMDLGYDLEEAEKLYVGGKAVPHYRVIVTGEEKPYLINAYTNEMK